MPELPMPLGPDQASMPMGNAEIPIPPMAETEPVSITGTMEPSAEERHIEEKAEEKSVQYSLSPDKKKEIVDYVIKAVDDCVASRQTWKSTLDECLKLYEGTREPKSDPWPNCSNISVMAVPTHCNLMHSKLFPAAWNENLTYWQPISSDDIDNVENVRRFMDWVIRRELKLADFIDDLLHDLIVYGTIVPPVIFKIVR